MNLVTGGTGLVGSYLLLQITENHQPIRAIYRSKSSIEKTKSVFHAYDAMNRFAKIEWVEAELTDYFSLKDAFEGITSVYHAAAKVSFSTKEEDQMMKTNIEGTAHIVNLSLDNNVDKLCYISSVASLGEYKKGCTDEEALWNSSKTSPYSISKYYAENEVWRASEEGLNVVIVNPATIMGYGDWNESSLAIIKRVADGLSFYPPGANGFVGVKDVANIAVQLMNSKIKNERYVLVAENISFQLLLSKIAKALSKAPPKYAAKKWMAKLIGFFDQLMAFFTGNKTVLNRGSIETAFKNKCFSAKKVERELNYNFQPITAVLEEAATHYLNQR